MYITKIYIIEIPTFEYSGTLSVYPSLSDPRVQVTGCVQKTRNIN